MTQTVATIRAALTEFDDATAACDAMNDQYRGVANWPEDACAAWQVAADRLLAARDQLDMNAVRFLLPVAERVADLEAALGLAIDGDRESDWNGLYELGIIVALAPSFSQQEDDLIARYDGLVTRICARAGIPNPLAPTS